MKFRALFDLLVSAIAVRSGNNFVPPLGKKPFHKTPGNCVIICDKNVQLNTFSCVAVHVLVLQRVSHGRNAPLSRRSR